MAFSLNRSFVLLIQYIAHIFKNSFNAVYRSLSCKQGYKETYEA